MEFFKHLPEVISLPRRTHLQEADRKLEQEIGARERLNAPIESPLRRRLTFGFVVAVLLTIFMGFSSWRVAQLAADEADWVAHSYTVMNRIELNSKHVIEMETSARGYAMGGQDSFLAHYESARDTVAQDENVLRHLTADNPNQQRRLDVLKPQVHVAIDSAETMVATRQQTHAELGDHEILESERILDALSATTEEMLAEETRLLTQRIQITKAGRRLTSFIIVGGVFVGATLLALARLAVNREIGVNARARAQIGILNSGLEQRVEERTVALAQLETSNKELEAFSYSVSHDLRAPLRHISGFSRMLVEEFGSTLDPNAHHYLERIQAGTKEMGLLVDGLLDLARVGRHALSLQPTRLNSIVAEVIAILQPETEGRQVEWVIADLPAVECDPVLVRQVFQNLLANALKFTRPRVGADRARVGTPAPASHTVIEVSHKEDDDGQWVFTVRDNGVGFSMKYVDKLFGVFQRLHSTDEFEGTGIGLVTVQRIVHKHGGRVWAEGEPDKGATFYFTLGVGKQAESKSNAAAAGGQS
jgi:signal transduction histidine kinase